jgi:hypothetical protein
MYVRMIVRTHEIQRSLLVMIFSGVLDRFPRLKLVSAENDIAWAPHLFERANKYYRRMKQAFQVPISLTPDEYFKRQIYVTFIDDPVGLKTYQLVGADNIMQMFAKWCVKTRPSCTGSRFSRQHFPYHLSRCSVRNIQR